MGGLSVRFADALRARRRRSKTLPRSVRFQAFGAVVIANLGAFVLITSLPAFQSAHHHWIFPILALALAGEWALTLLAAPGSLAASEAVRSDVLSTLALIVFM